MEQISDCCKRVNPCEAVCLLNNVLVDLAMGKAVTSYKVGGESFTFARPSISSVKALLKHFEEQCNKAQGRPARRRAKWCFVHADPTCGSCGKTNNRCRCM